jgi:RsiW-degrading membrane proteinase PrsW (M82 family)
MASTLTINGISAIFLTGFIPPLLWLWFWLKEDPHPEPKRSLLTSFVLGMAVVPVVLIAEFLWLKFAIKAGLPGTFTYSSLWLLAPWAFIEEVAKFSVAWFSDLKKSVYDEPVDAIIYIITVALGLQTLGL